jgi:hypothetical protein
MIARGCTLQGSYMYLDPTPGIVVRDIHFNAEGAIVGEVEGEFSDAEGGSDGMLAARHIELIDGRQGDRQRLCCMLPSVCRGSTFVPSLHPDIHGRGKLRDQWEGDHEGHAAGCCHHARR